MVENNSNTIPLNPKPVKPIPPKTNPANESTSTPAPTSPPTTSPPKNTNPRVDSKGKKYSVQNPPKLPAPKPGEPLNLPPVPHIKSESIATPKTVEDSKLIESLVYMKTKKFMQESKSPIKFDTVKEAEDSAKEDVVSAINERLHNLKQDISDLQKKGHNLVVQTMKLMQVPLKTRLWKATRSIKDLVIIYTIILGVESIVRPIKEMQEKKNISEEERIKNKEAQLIKEKQTAKAYHKKLFEPIIKPQPNAKTVTTPPPKNSVSPSVTPPQQPQTVVKQPIPKVTTPQQIPINPTPQTQPKSIQEEPKK